MFLMQLSSVLSFQMISMSHLLSSERPGKMRKKWMQFILKF